MTFDPIENIVRTAFGGAAELTRDEKQQMIDKLQAYADEYAQAARDRAVELHAENNRLRAALEDISRMAHAFDTPRDPGRVQAFVGDIRNVSSKALANPTTHTN